jgi:folate-dependent tRNA-U54 methylase TrmFO/GidA
LRAGIELVQVCRLDDAEPQLVKAFVAGKLFFREHEVTTDAISVLADTTSVLHVCLRHRRDYDLAAEVVTSTAHTLSRVMQSTGLRREAMRACHHLLTLNEIPQQVPAAAQLAMARYIQSPHAVAH